MVSSQTVFSGEKGYDPPSPSGIAQEEALKDLNKIIQDLSENPSEKAITKGILVSKTDQKKRPFGILLLANPGNSSYFNNLLAELKPIDFMIHFPVKINELFHRLSYLNREIKKLKKQVMIDEMTRMYNYRFFKKQLKTEINRSQRTGFPCSLILLDIDHFKAINDNYGHLTGNEVIKEVAKRIKRSIRTIDYPARYGGDEFAVILPSTGLVEAIGIAERIRKSIADDSFKRPDIPPLSLTVTGGVAEFSDLFHTSMKSLIEAADKALYQAKEMGRNLIGYAKDDLDKITGVGVRREEKELLLKTSKNKPPSSQ